MTAYYNEIDPHAAAWLRELIAQKQIPAGEVDERSIADVRAEDLRGFTQHHWFGGIGGWAYALRLAGWPDDRPVWTGSCPCPPFSQAGKGSECPSCGGKSCLAHPLVTAGWICLDCGDEWRGDDRHLLPEFIRLIGECRPATVYGEQVASRDGVLWLYALRAVLEECGYAIGAADLPSAGVGSPNIRQRLWFVGVADSEYPERRAVNINREDGRDGADTGRKEAHGQPGARGEVRGLADIASERWNGVEDTAGAAGWGGTEAGGGDGRLADAHGGHTGAERQQPGGEHGQQPQDGGATGGLGDTDSTGSQPGNETATPAGYGHPSLADGLGHAAGPTHGFWRDADWLGCRDGKWRPAQSSIFPLVAGLPAGVVRGGDPSAPINANASPEACVTRVRGYGNAINPYVAKAFIEATQGAIAEMRATA